MPIRTRLLVALLAVSATASLSTTAAATSSGDRAGDGTYGYVPTLPVAPQGIDYLSGFADGTAYVKHSDGGVALLARSTDYGLTWSRLADPPAAGSAITKFVTPIRGYSLGRGVVSVTTDGAASWRPTSTVPSTTGFTSLTALGVGDARSAGTVYVAGDDFGPPVPGVNLPLATYVWASQDGGRRWSRTQLPDDLFVDDIRVYDGKRAAARVYDIVGNRGDRNAIWTTADGGRTWRRAFDCPEICTSLAYAGPAKLLAGAVDGRLFASTDNGRRWSLNRAFALPAPRPEPALENTHWVSGIAFTPDGRTAVVGTNGRGTYRSTDAGRTWTMESPSPQEVYGVGIGDAVVFDRQRALVGGPNALAVRTQLSSSRGLPPGADQVGELATHGRVAAQGPVVQRLVDGQVRLVTRRAP